MKKLVLAAAFVLLLAPAAFAQEPPTEGPCCPAACTSEDLPDGVGCIGIGAEACIGGDSGAPEGGAHGPEGCTCAAGMCVCTGPEPCDLDQCSAAAAEACCNHLPAGDPNCA